MKPMPQLIEIEVEIKGLDGDDLTDVEAKADAVLGHLLNLDNFTYFVDVEAEATSGDYPRWRVTAMPVARHSVGGTRLLESP